MVIPLHGYISKTIRHDKPCRLQTPRDLLLYSILSYGRNVDLDASKLIFNVDRNHLPSQT